jgi:hypothetical protein
MAKGARPALQAPEISTLHRLAAVPATSASDPRFATAETLEDPANLQRRVKEGSVRVLNPDTIQQGQPTEPDPRTPPRRRGPELALSTKVPDYVMQQLRIRSAQKGLTIRNLLLLALRREGLEIDDADIQDDRKRR